MVILGPDGRIEDCSVILAPQLGGCVEQIIGQPITEFIPGMTVDRLLELIEPGTRDAVTRGIAGRTLQGGSLDLALLVSPSVGADGRALCSVVVRDISHEVKTERLLQDELMLSDHAVRGARIGVFEYFPDSDLVTVSRIWRELMGIYILDSDAMQAEWRRRVHPDDLALALEPVEICLSGQRGFAHADYRVRPREAGRWRWFRTGVSVAERDETGRPTRVTGAMIDVTELKEAELELRRSGEQLRLAFDHAPIGKALVSLDGRFGRVNPALCGFLGYDKEELLSLGYDSIVHPDDLAEDRARLEQLFQGAISSFQSEKRLLRKDGSVIWGLMIGAIVRDAAGRPIEWLLQLVDITEQRRLAEMKSEFVSTVSHELRTPLTSVLGALKLLGTLETDSLSDQAARLLYIAEQNGHRLHALIDDILDFEKFSTGKGSFTSQRCAIVPLVEESVLANTPIADKYHVRCTVTAQDRTLKGYCDPKRFQQVMANLLSNAAKFAREGTAILVDVMPSELGLTVSVFNEGPGIPDSFRASIFRPFAQAELSATRSRGGTGLGLSICKEIVERGGGTIGYDSTPGEGTTFWFTVPVDAPEDRYRS
ncbi:MAG: PAS domain S-box protein [Rhodobacteraceae bacterium]|nr:PAS domain S-box protein [Paracoccaceae bacterium]